MMTCAQRERTGLRRFDEAAAKADRLCEQFAGLEEGVTPGRALLALKKAAPYMGIPLRMIAMVDLLFSWTRPQDWHSGNRVPPTVFPSNELLAQKLGVGVRQVQKLLNEAQRRGLIGFRDSPNGHRGGQRNAEGTLRWAYGIVLAPIGTRYAEFMRIAERGTAEDAKLDLLRKRLAAARRKIRSLAASAAELGLEHLKADHEVELAQMATAQMRRVRDLELITGCVEQIEGRQAGLERAIYEVLGAMNDRMDQEESSCSDDQKVIHSTTTTQPQSAKAVTSRGLPIESSGTYDVRRAGPQTKVEEDLERHGISPAFVSSVAPELCGDLLCGAGQWGDLVAIAERLAGQNAISQHAWREACRVMGQRGAAASVIATVEKYRAGEVRRPGAYLRGMSGKAERGELNLGRTLHGLKDVARSTNMRAMAAGDTAAPIGSLLFGRLAAMRASNHGC